MVEEKGEGEKMKRILPLFTDLLLRYINLVIFYIMRGYLFTLQCTLQKHV